MHKNDANDADTLITNVRLLLPGPRIVHGSLLITGTTIGDINPSAISPGIRQIDGGGRLLTPGLIDLHSHGIGPFQYERCEEDLHQSGALLARHGTTCVLLTLVRCVNPKSLGHLEHLAARMTHGTRAYFPGFHLEGPFLALRGAGADTIAGDQVLLDEIVSAGRNRITAMSVSPDTINILPVIERLAEKGIIPFITHTRASAEQTEAAIAAGARHATHFYDVFPVPEESDPGVRPVGAVEAIMADPRCTVDFICDGVHVHPVAIRAALVAKGFQGVLLITDSNVGAGMPDGIYPAQGFDVRVSAGNATRIHDPRGEKHGWLAGSALTMDVGIANLHRWLTVPPEQIWAMGTSNVARMLGLKNKGRIEVGADADLVLWHDNFKALRTWVGGELVYERDWE